MTDCGEVFVLLQARPQGGSGGSDEPPRRQASSAKFRMHAEKAPAAGGPVPGAPRV